MKTETVIKKNKWFKESCLIEDEKQVYCRLYKQDFNSDEEADAAADLIATAVNACKEINKDNPLNVAKAIPEMFKALIRWQDEWVGNGTPAQRANNYSIELQINEAIEKATKQ